MKIAGKAEIPPGAVAREWREGWKVVLAAALGYGTGGGMVMMTAGLFIKPMREELGWSTSAVTIAPIISLVWAFSAPFGGAAVDRFGSRRVAIFAASALLASILTLAVVPITRFSLYSLAVVIGICGPLTNVGPYARGVASWFRHSVGAAFGLTLNGVAIVGLMSVPVASAAIHYYGWRAGYVALAAIILFLGLPAIVGLFRERPAPLVPGPAEVKSGKTFAEAIRDFRFWAFVGAFGIGSIPLGGFMGHLQPLLADKAFGIAEATSLGVLYAGSIILGRLAGGFLLDRFWDCAVAATLFALAAAGGVLLGNVVVEISMPFVILAVFLVGMGQGAEADFIAFFTLRSFGMRAYSTLLGGMAMASSLGLAMGAWSYAALFDYNGNYLIACYFGGGCFFAAGLIILTTGVVESLRPPAAKVI